MARDEQQTEKYGDVVERLDQVVKKLEGGELSLEDSLKAFEEGIGLVRKGERLLGAAEKRIEQLLSDDGHDKVVPLEGADMAAPSQGQSRTKKPLPPAEEDVPF
jgi:exodeoxyribonuclease VII small subunit